MNTDKRFWLFVMSQYYPGGGMDDFLDSFDSIGEAVARWKEEEPEYCGYGFAHIYDTQERTRIDAKDFQTALTGEDK